MILPDKCPVFFAKKLQSRAENAEKTGKGQIIPIIFSIVILPYPVNKYKSFRSNTLYKKEYFSFSQAENNKFIFFTVCSGIFCKKGAHLRVRPTGYYACKYGIKTG